MVDRALTIDAMVRALEALESYLRNHPAWSPELGFLRHEVRNLLQSLKVPDALEDGDVDNLLERIARAFDRWKQFEGDEP